VHDPDDEDLNLRVAGELQDLGLVHSVTHARIAYRRAARAVLALEEPVDAVVERGALRSLRHIGPASERIVLEVLEHGHSDTVARAVAGSGRADVIEDAHRMRANFLSRAGALQALHANHPGAVTREECRADLQMHTEWSDGAAGIESMAAAGRERGYTHIAVTDHGYGLPIAGGMSMLEARDQHAAIARANAEWQGAFRVLRGIEANIPAAGGVDMEPAELAEFELVLAAPHSKLRRPEDQTERMLAAVRHPSVHVLAHPRGRMMTRQGVLANWDDVFAAAARHGVAIELDGDPWRQDLDHALARRALAAGCLFALDSDAHSPGELRYADIAVAHARLAGIPAERVINTWPVDRLVEWAARGAPRGRARQAPR